MSDLVKGLRTAARKACERHNRVDQFDPAWERRPKDFIEWEAADEIERLRGEIQAYKAEGECWAERLTEAKAALGGMNE